MTTRYERLSSRSRRLEATAVVATAACTLALCLLAPDRGAAVDPAPRLGHVADARPGDRQDAAPPALPRSAPLRVSIPGTGVDARAVVSWRAVGALSVAAPARPMRVAWDGAGPAPGEDGAALLVGSLDSAEGPAAFAGVGGLRAGARVRIERADDRTAWFAVYGVRRYDTGGTPGDLLVADPAQAHGPELRIVARGGAATRDPDDDATVVVRAHAVRR
ncbi:class F sortase [Streptomyces sp. TR06-5]|uniref:class F sortase n=1 Tax=unclassified Streptomyces TaxID=2593676 RepID=UPI0039A342E8